MPDYVVITPVRDEAAHLSATVACMVAQTVTPTAWVIVDDGSRDATREIATSAASAHAWIRVVARDDRGYRQAGIGVVEAFYDGLATVSTDWAFLVKLDGDVELGPDYFERCFARFDADPQLGIGGGVFHNPTPDGRYE